MGITIKQAIDAFSAIETLIEEDKSDNLIFASSVRCRLAQNQRLLRPVIEGYVKLHNGLVEQYGSPEEKDGVPSGRKVVDPSSDNGKSFEAARNKLLSKDADVSLLEIRLFELAGVTEAEFSNPNADPRKQNQIPTHLISALYDCGVLKA